MGTTIRTSALANNDRVLMGDEPVTIVETLFSTTWNLYEVQYRYDNTGIVNRGFFVGSDRFTVVEGN